MVIKSLESERLVLLSDKSDLLYLLFNSQTVKKWPRYFVGFLEISG